MTQIIILGSFYEIKTESQLVEYFPSMPRNLGFDSQHYNKQKLGMVVHTYNPSIQKTEANGLRDIMRPSQYVFLTHTHTHK